MLNVQTVADEETEEQKVEKHKTFVEKYTKEIQHFGMCLHRRCWNILRIFSKMLMGSN